jgi:hypothetical protein
VGPRTGRQCSSEWALARVVSALVSGPFARGASSLLAPRKELGRSSVGRKAYYDSLRRTTTYYDVLRRTTTYYDVPRLTTTYYEQASCSPARAADVAELVDVLLAPLALSRHGVQLALTLTLTLSLTLTLALT